jgi:addiction module RelE/StbE family toxin
MPYALFTTPQAAKTFHKFPSHIRQDLIEETMKLSEQPLLGEPLKGQFRSFRSLHIKLSNVQYRVVYEVDEGKKVIYIHAVGTRQNFYIRLQRMKPKSLKAA